MQRDFMRNSSSHWSNKHSSNKQQALQQQATSTPATSNKQQATSNKQQALQHPVHKEHLSIQLLETIQAILFLIICCRAPNSPNCLYYFTDKALCLKCVCKSIPICVLKTNKFIDQ